jgi:hypothetical protein
MDWCQDKKAPTRLNQAKTARRQTAGSPDVLSCCPSEQLPSKYEEETKRLGEIKTDAIQEFTSTKIGLLQLRPAQQEKADCLISFGRFCGHPFP